MTFCCTSQLHGIAHAHESSAPPTLVDLKLRLLTSERSRERAMPLPKNLPQQSKAQAKHGASFKSGVPPRVLANRYRVEQRLGSGAFGTVFLVTDLRAGNERYDTCNVCFRPSPSLALQQ